MNRGAVTLCCICWILIIGHQAPTVGPVSATDSKESDARSLASSRSKNLFFLFILALGIVERLSRLANLVSIERDWVPTLAATTSDDQQASQYDLTYLNAMMGGIDLVCKLGSPIAISMFMATSVPPWLGAVVLVATNLATWPFEYWTARTVWEKLSSLEEPDVSNLKEDTRNNHETSLHIWQRRYAHSLLQAIIALWYWLRAYGSSLHGYFTAEVWMPSLAMTGLHFSVLNFSSTLTVFLLHSGFSMRLITGAEILSAAFELSSIYLYPFGVGFLSPRRTKYVSLADADNETVPRSPTSARHLVRGAINGDDGSSQYEIQTLGVSKLGLLALALMILCLVGRNSRDVAQSLTDDRYQQPHAYGRFRTTGPKSASPWRSRLSLFLPGIAITSL